MKNKTSKLKLSITLQRPIKFIIKLIVRIINYLLNTLFEAYLITPLCCDAIMKLTNSNQLFMIETSFNYIYAYICTTYFCFSSPLLHLAKIYWCPQNAKNDYGAIYCSHIVIALSTLSLLISLLQLLYSVDLL